MEQWLVAVVFMFLGAVASYYVARHFFSKGGGARSTLTIELAEVARLEPSLIGVRLEMKVGTTAVDNIVLLEVAVSNKGPKDVVVADAGDSQKAHLRPCIELPRGWRLLADPWNPDGSSPRADVRVARQMRDSSQLLYVHVHRLAVGDTSRARLLCSFRGAVREVPRLTGPGLKFDRGFLPDVDIEGRGLLG